MIVTIISDASVHEGIGAWAAWAKSERGHIGVRAAVFRNSCPNSAAAELMAFVNGLHMAIAAGVAVDGDTVLAQIDNQHVMALISGRRKLRQRAHGREEVEAALLALRAVMDKHKMKLLLRHIKAHSGTETPRTYVHDRCDRAARNARRRAARQRPGIDATGKPERIGQ